jgi:hypothetical protein
MSEEQAGRVLQAASGRPTAYVKVVKVSRGQYAATHAANEAGELACGTWTRHKAAVAEVGTDLAGTTCHFCRAELGLDDHTDASGRLEALFVLSLTLGLRPGNCASSHGTTWTSTGASSTCGGPPARPEM